MTGVELERAAAAIVTPAAAGGLCLVTDEQQRHRVAFVIAGRGKAPVGRSFAKPRDAARFMDLLAGDVPTPRPGQTTARHDPTPGGTAVASGGAASAGNRSSSSAGPTGAPDGQSFAAGALCVGCGKPVPLGRRGQRRLARGPACRQLARRHHTSVTTPAPREAVDGAQTTASLGARVQPQVPRQRPAGRAIDLTPQG